jgi:DNA-binding NarL/FixJ family response regulator
LSEYVVLNAEQKRCRSHLAMSTTSAIATSPRPSVLLADDHATMLQTVASVLSPHFDVVATARDGKAALDMAARTNPALVVLDVMMPELDGFRTARELTQRKSPAKIVFLTGQEDDDYIFEALSLGARGYVAKRRLHSDLVRALNVASTGQLYISPHAFTARPKNETNQHVLQFYSEESTFLCEATERTCAALINGELVFTLLSKRGLHFVRERLRERGLDYMAIIRGGHYWTFSIENFLEHTWPDVASFDDLVRACLKRAVTQSQQSGSKLTIVSDVMATFGCDYEIAARMEAVWNDVIPEHACIVYCGCPVTHLVGHKCRETLSRICTEHDKVIPISR